MFVKPAEGIKVRDPISLKHIPAEGKKVPANNFWRRRIACGDVVLIPDSVVDPK